jgi:hypothetical protein
MTRMREIRRTLLEWIRGPMRGNGGVELPLPIAGDAFLRAVAEIGERVPAVIVRVRAAGHGDAGDTCIYHAADESLVRRHAELGGFPANKISRVTTIIDPATAE